MSVRQGQIPKGLLGMSVRPTHEPKGLSQKEEETRGRNYLAALMYLYSKQDRNMRFCGMEEGYAWFMRGMAYITVCEDHYCSAALQCDLSTMS